MRREAGTVVKLATHISLPRGKRPRFPALCCCCLVPGPERRIGCSGKQQSLWDWLAPWGWLSRERVRFEVPICAKCRPRVVRSRRLRLVALAAILVVAAPWVVVWTGGFGWEKQSRRIVGAAILAAASLPVVSWQVARPLGVTLSVRKDVVWYEFASEEYALAFHLRNPEGICEDWELKEVESSDERDG